MEKKSKKPINVLKVTTAYWVRVKDKMQYEVKAKDIFGSKYTLTVDSNEPIPDKKAERVVTKSEWKRIDSEMKELIKKCYDNVVKKITKLAKEETKADGPKVRLLNPDR